MKKIDRAKNTTVSTNNVINSSLRLAYIVSPVIFLLRFFFFLLFISKLSPTNKLSNFLLCFSIRKSKKKCFFVSLQPMNEKSIRTELPSTVSTNAILTTEDTFQFLLFSSEAYHTSDQSGESHGSTISARFSHIYKYNNEISDRRQANASTYIQRFAREGIHFSYLCVWARVCVTLAPLLDARINWMNEWMNGRKKERRVRCTLNELCVINIYAWILQMHGTGSLRWCGWFDDETIMINRHRYRNRQCIAVAMVFR